jgi:GTPase SAR1 family protein
MFDLNSRLSYKNLPRYVKDVKRVVDKTIPIFVLGNKVDLQEFRVKPKHITYPSKFGYPFFYISAKAQYQVVDVYLTLLRALTGDKELVFTEQFPMIEP